MQRVLKPAFQICRACSPDRGTPHAHNTVLRFSKMQINPKLSPQLFKFVPPKGADVLGE